MKNKWYRLRQHYKCSSCFSPHLLTCPTLWFSSSQHSLCPINPVYLLTNQLFINSEGKSFSRWLLHNILNIYSFYSLIILQQNIHLNVQYCWWLRKCCDYFNNLIVKCYKIKKSIRNVCLSQITYDFIWNTVNDKRLPFQQDDKSQS